MKAIHNIKSKFTSLQIVVLYPKDTEKWKQFTTNYCTISPSTKLCCIPKILKNESNSQRSHGRVRVINGCVVSQRYWKMKAIHNILEDHSQFYHVVLYPKDTEKWKQFTTIKVYCSGRVWLCCIPKILKNESNSQPRRYWFRCYECCVVSQRYWKMKAIHNLKPYY